jgi:hypothetical protein
LVPHQFWDKSHMPPVSIYAVDDDPLMNEIITVLLRGEG